MKAKHLLEGQAALLERPGATSVSRPKFNAWRQNQAESTKPAATFRLYNGRKLPGWSITIFKTAVFPELTSNSIQSAGALSAGAEQTWARASDEWAPSFLRRLAAFSELETGWDSYEAPPPNARARFEARQAMLALAQGAGCRPIRIAPSVEGGVAISWRRGRKNANIEFFNSGEVYAALSDGAGEPQIKEVLDGELEPTLVWIRDYFQG